MKYRNFRTRITCFDLSIFKYSFASRLTIEVTRNVVFFFALLLRICTNILSANKKNNFVSPYAKLYEINENYE